MEILQNEMREKALSDAKWKQIQQDLNQTVSVTTTGQPSACIKSDLISTLS